MPLTVICETVDLKQRCSAEKIAEQERLKKLDGTNCAFCGAQLH